MSSELRIKNHVVFLDDEDYLFFKDKKITISDKTRHKTRKLYAEYCEYKKGSRVRIPLHRLIMGELDPNIIIDHKNGNSLDCTRSNLRRATHKQNVSSAAPIKGTSDHKGVHFHKNLKRWVARITVEGRRLYLGSYSDELEAAAAYARAARNEHGEFAWVGNA
jgi:hypothetical protein